MNGCYLWGLRIRVRVRVRVKVRVSESEMRVRVVARDVIRPNSTPVHDQWYTGDKTRSVLRPSVGLGLGAVNR